MEKRKKRGTYGGPIQNLCLEECFVMYEMTRRDYLRASLLSLAGLAFTGGCGGFSIHHRERDSHSHGPPPHAPAHGYRHKTKHGMEIVYDSECGVYVVVGFLDHYYHRERYYRWHRDRWEISASFDGDWKSMSAKKLPSGLRLKTKGKGKGKKHSWKKHGRKGDR